ncbi:hypothetical protein ACHMW6_06260 [Pseudoduganella sp. UC29_106]|uniref:hypothetical protein n=1 Tax=Pseudoduganella sp. UC29_106 TaxID=3374553 RepID=UPI003756F0D1
MKRKLWQCLVNGRPQFIVILVLLTVLETIYQIVTGRDLTGAIATHTVLLALNWYSWDYQRRHSGRQGK